MNLTVRSAPSGRARRALGSTAAVFVVLILVVTARVAEVSFGGVWRGDPANGFTQGFYDTNIRWPDVVTTDGVVVATSVLEHGQWRRVYPLADMTPWLGVAVHGGAVFGFERRAAALGGATPIGVTVSEPLTEAAVSALAGLPGAVVVMRVDDGAVLAAVDTTTAPTVSAATASDPGFAPDRKKPFDLYPRGSEPVILTRAMNPGSALKPLVVAAALDQRVTRPDEVFPSESGYAPPSGRWITNAGGASCPRVRLTEAIALSCNNVVARLATRLGKGGMERMLRAAGFGKAPPSDIDIAAAPDPFAAALGANPADVVTLVALGQGDARIPVVSLVALYAGIANKGRVPTPRLGASTSPTTWIPQLMSPEAAAVVTAGMRAAVDHGTASRFGDDQVAAKTGTAQTASGASNAWVAGFYPADHPKIAFAVFREAAPGDELAGGRDAVPIAAEVLSAVQELELAR